MPLTPEDVSNKRFTPVRLREGYDMGEVDQFLDEVESELSRLTQENEDLRSKVSSAQGAGSTSSQSPRSGQPTTETVAVSTQTPPATQERRPEPPPAPVSAPAAAEAPAQPVHTVSQASNAAARLLEIATRNADELVDMAKNDADKIIGEARTKSERLESESKTKADRLESDARTRAQMLDSETSERRQQMLGALENDRDKLSVEVENLRSFEREYRSRLRSSFSQQLEALGTSNDSASPQEEQSPAPKRLRSILDKDEA